MSDENAQLAQIDGKATQKRGRGNPAWAKDPVTGIGKSGNPAGPTAHLEKFRRLCRKRRTAALAVLDQALCMIEENPLIAISAAKTLLEFGYGKAPAEIKLSNEDGEKFVVHVEVSNKALDERHEALEKMAGALLGLSA